MLHPSPLSHNSHPCPVSVSPVLCPSPPSCTPPSLTPTLVPSISPLSLPSCIHPLHPATATSVLHPSPLSCAHPLHPTPIPSVQHWYPPSHNCPLHHPLLPSITAYRMGQEGVGKTMGCSPSAMRCSGTWRVILTTRGQLMWEEHTRLMMQLVTLMRVSVVLFTGLRGDPTEKHKSTVKPEI